MGDLDLEIMKLRQFQKKLENQNIKEGIYVNEKFVEFEERSFFNNKVSMWVPKSFVEMPGEFAKIKYPYEQRPKFILTSLDVTVNLSLNLFDQPISFDEIKQAVKGYKMLLRRSQPTILFFAEVQMETGNGEAGWFDYKTYALDKSIYNLMFITSIGGKLFLGTFNCIFKDFTEWKVSILQMIHSILDLTKKDR